MPEALILLPEDVDPAGAWDEATALRLAEDASWSKYPTASLALAGARILASYGDNGRPGLLALAISVLDDAHDRAEQLSLTEQADTALCLGEALREGAGVFGEPDWLDDAIEVGTTAATMSGLSWAWMALCETHRSAYRTTGIVRYLHEALGCAREAVQTAADEEISVMSSNLGVVAMQAAGDLGKPTLWVEAVDAATAAVRNTLTDDDYRAVYLSNLALAQSALAEHAARPALARRAARTAMRAVKRAPSSVSALLTAYSCIDTVAKLTDAEGAYADAADLLARADSLSRGGPRRPQVLLERSQLAQRRYDRDGHIDLLLEAVRYAERAVRAQGGALAAGAETLMNLAICRTRVNETTRPGTRSLNRYLATRALARADASQRPRLAADAALVWLSHHEQTGADSSVHTAIRLLRQAASSPAVSPSTWSNLAGALLVTFDNDPTEALAHEATQAARMACGAALPGSRDRALFDAVLAACLEASFRISNDLDELREAAHRARAAARTVNVTSPDCVAVWTNCAVALRTSFEQQSTKPDLELAVALLDQALPRVLPGARPTCLAQLVATLRTRFDARGDLKDLCRALATAGELAGHGLAVTRAGAAAISGCAMSAYEATGHLEHLDTAVGWARTALTRHARIAEVRAAALTALANALLSRFEVIGEEQDLTESLRRARQAINASPSTSGSLPGRHANLANNLRLRASLGGGGQAAALRAARTSVQLAHPKDKDLPAYLNGLALALAGLGRHTDATRTLRQAVAACPDESPAKAFYQVNLAASLRDEFLSGANRRTLGQAIRILRQVPRSRAPWALVGQVVLGECLHARGGTEDLDAALRCWKAVFEYELAPAWLRLLAATSAAHAMAQSTSGTAASDWSTVADHCRRALALQDRAAWHGLAWPSRRKFLAAHPDLGINAAAAALNARADAGEALTALEAGRATVWRGRTVMRGPGNGQPLVDRLRRLADELDALDRHGSPSVGQGHP